MTRRYYYRPWKEETLVAALHFMRCQIVRDEAEGLKHIDALLTLRGVDPDSLPLPQKFPKTFKRGHLSQAILRELRGGPLRGSELARRLQGNLAYADAYRKVYAALHRLKERRILENQNAIWKVME